MEKGEWIDPSDLRVNQRTGRVVRGYRTMCPLDRMSRTSPEIMKEHIYAANYVRRRYDVATIGFSAPKDDIPVTQIVYLPRLDFSKACHSQAKAGAEFQRIWSTLQPRQQRMAYVIILRNYSVEAWCRFEHERTGVLPNRQREVGKLVGMLDHLARYLDREIDDALQSEMIMRQ